MAAKIIKITRFVFFKTIFVKSLSIFVNARVLVVVEICCYSLPFFLVKNTPSMRATKIIKNMSMGIWWLCWTVVLHTSVGLISLTHASMDSDNHTTTLCLLCSQEPPKSYHVLRTLRCPSESIRPMDVRFCFVVLAQLPNPLRVLSKTQPLAGWWGTYLR